MKTIRISLENCYGIKKLDADFHFSEHSAYAVYAPNGSMKSSFAQTFSDVANSTASVDRIFPTRVCKREILNEVGTPIAAGEVFVISPYDEGFGHSAKTSTLLVDTKLRKEYEELHSKIEECKAAFIKALKDQSRSKKDIEREISETFTSTENSFYRALIRIRDEIESQKEAPFSELQYDVIFDDKVMDILGQKDFKTAIDVDARRKVIH
jgi:hypothetical protein